MNPVVISTIIAAASFILTIFSAIYLNQRHVDKLVEQLEKRFEARITGLEPTTNARFDSVNARFEKMEQIINSRFQAVEARIEQIAF
jgi:hypothetical protein